MYSLTWVRTMENSMGARVSAVITTLKHVLCESHSEGSFLNQTGLHKGCYVRIGASHLVSKFTKNRSFFAFMKLYLNISELASN